MLLTARDIIQTAYQWSNIHAIQVNETVESNEFDTGLMLLNVILNEWGLNPKKIPFTTFYTQNLVAGQETQFFPNLVFAQTVAYFNNGSLRYGMDRMGKTNYYGSSRANVTTLSFEYTVQRVDGGSNILFYPFPSGAFQCQVLGKLVPSTIVSLDYDMSTLYSEISIRMYIMFLVAREISIAYTREVPQVIQDKINSFEASIKTMETLDIPTKNTRIWGSSTGVNSAVAFTNLGNGYAPPGFAGGRLNG